MFDAWTIAAVGGGSGVLTYLAAGYKEVDPDNKKTLRLSIDNSGSLVGDVRLWGGALTGLASWWVKGANAKKGLQYVTAASWLSLLQTEIVRWRLLKAGDNKIAGDLPIFPKYGATQGALPGPRGNAAGHQRQAAWARR